MGIKLLNSLIKSECKNSNTLTSLYRLKDKVIVIDTSIYLYRFKSNAVLIENMYLLCGILRYYNIKPIFIFDGIPPPRKSEELKERKRIKNEARENYYAIKDLAVNKKDKRELEKLRRIFTSINKQEVNDVKKLLKLFGITYIVAEGEADELCAKMVICGKAYACLSEDTDLFAYGCPRVLRYLSLKNHTVILYDFKKILEELRLDEAVFREMCIHAGTDYIKKKNNIYYYYDMYKRGERIALTAEEQEIYKMFDLKKDKVFDDLLIENGPINKSELFNFMSKYNFIFI